jgi:hypothetical protein
MKNNRWNIKGQTTPVRIPNDYIDFVIKAIFKEKKRREKKRSGTVFRYDQFGINEIKTINYARK